MSFRLVTSLALFACSTDIVDGFRKPPKIVTPASELLSSSIPQSSGASSAQRIFDMVANTPTTTTTPATPASMDQQMQFASAIPKSYGEATAKRVTEMMVGTTTTTSVAPKISARAAQLYARVYFGYSGNMQPAANGPADVAAEIDQKWSLSSSELFEWFKTSTSAPLTADVDVNDDDKVVRAAAEGLVNFLNDKARAEAEAKAATAGDSSQSQPAPSSSRFSLVGGVLYDGDKAVSADGEGWSKLQEFLTDTQTTTTAPEANNTYPLPSMLSHTINGRR